MLYRSIDCPSRGCNKSEAMDRSVVSLAVSISQGGRSLFHVKTSCAALAIHSFVGCACVQVSVTQNGDYLMSDNSHYLKTRAETVSTLTQHPRFILAK